MNKLKFLSVLLILMSGTALAAMPTFQDLDTNKDKVLSKQEVVKVLVGIDFADADKNNDGNLNQEEYKLVIKQLTTIDENNRS